MRKKLLTTLQILVVPTMWIGAYVAMGYLWLIKYGGLATLAFIEWMPVAFSAGFIGNTLWWIIRLNYSLSQKKKYIIGLSIPFGLGYSFFLLTFAHTLEAGSILSFIFSLPSLLLFILPYFSAIILSELAIHSLGKMKSRIISSNE